MVISMANPENILLLLVCLPLAGAALTFLAGFVNRSLSGPIATLVVGLCFLLSCKLVATLGDSHAITATFGTWIAVQDLSLSFDIYFDSLAAVMCLVITGIGTLIHLYSVGYMSSDAGVSRYFSFLNLFIFSMLILVLGKNLPVVFIGWEGVGLCSYLLIGFWYSKADFVLAGQKAFVMNRLGDLGFIIAMAVLFSACGTLDIVELSSSANLARIGEGAALLAGLTLFFAATGKSAQFPLFTWLPDAMAGPTPVSALIHAATMVTAGIYLTSRMHGLLELSPEVLSVITWTGLVTALLAATVALVQTDIKKVLAYSTVSQLGFMFIAVGSGYYSVALFHVVTHAFFKACLFLSAGSVIHGCHHEQDMRRMGGLYKSMPITTITYGCASLAIAGIAPFAGYFSKHAIFDSVAHNHNIYLLPFQGSIQLVANLVAVLTAVYMARSFIMTFLGSYRGEARPHEVGVTMWLPVVVLAGLSVFGGLWLHSDLFAFMNDVLRTPVFVGQTQSILNFIIGSLPGVIGIAMAAVLLLKVPLFTEKLQSMGWMFQKLWERKYYLDEIYEAVVIGPLRSIGRFIAEGISQGCVERVGGGMAIVVQATGELARRGTTGLVGSYALYMLLAIAVLVGILV